MQSIKLPPLGDELWRDFLPALAPLPEAFVFHLYASPGALRLPRSSAPLVDQIWSQIQRARQIVSYFLVPAVDAMQQKVEVNWFQRNWQIFAGKGKILPRSSYEEWINKRLVRSLGFGVLEPNSVAALMMMRYLVLKDHRFWLPRWQKPDAPWFFVWGLRPDEQIPRIYPYPLPDDIPANTLFWTQWVGAGWLPGWIRIPGLGSLAWGKITTIGDQWYWDLTEEDLAVWDRSLVREASVTRRCEILASIYHSQPPQSYHDVEERYQRTRLHTLSTLVLQCVGEPLFAGYINHFYSSEKPPTQPYKPF